jgi:hypothetical protein
MKKISYCGYRFPPEIINQAIWLYLRFTLSFRDVEDLLAERAMEEQSGREFASADPTAGAQDAALQERGLSPEVSLNPRRRLQHFQRPTPSHVSSITPRAPRRGDDHVA